MTSESSGRDPVEQMLESIVEAHRRGGREAVEEYIQTHPEHSEKIRDLLPTLMLMEDFGSFPEDASAARPKTSHDATARRLGDYRILREVGRGGMGIVYEAIQESLGRHVALKICSFHGPINDKFLERFQREAQAAGQLHHTNIVPVFGVGVHDGTHYYAMQFILGQSLSTVLQDVKRLRFCEDLAGSSSAGKSDSQMVAEALLRDQFQSYKKQIPIRSLDDDKLASAPTTDKPTELAEIPSSSLASSNSHSEIITSSENQYYRSIARIGLQVAEALRHAHEQGIVHRDIKPSNLILDTTGRVWITDFGLAKADGDADLSIPGEIVGTLRYMAPERFQGEADARSDVYSLGVTLYELVTLRPPFDDVKRVELIDRIRNEIPTSPRKIYRAIPRDLETIIVKAIAKEPAQRYSSAGAISEDLRQFLGDLPINARRISLPERLWRWSKRNPALALWTSLSMLLLVSIAILSSVFALSLGREKNATQHQLVLTRKAERQSKKQLQRAQAAEKKVKRELISSKLAHARALRLTGQVGLRFESLNVLTEAAGLLHDFSPDSEKMLALRNAYIAASALQADLRLIKKVEHNGFAVDPQLQCYIYHDKDGDIHICRVADDQEIGRLSASKHIRTKVFYPWQFVFSPNGRYLATRYTLDRAFVGSELVLLWDIETRELLLQERPPRSEFVLEYTPDSRLLAFSKNDGKIHLFDMAARKELPPLEVGAGKPQQLKFRPDGQQIAVSVRAGREIRIMEWDSRKIVRVFRLSNTATNFEWSPDGTHLGFQQGMNLNILNLETGRTSSVLKGHRWFGVRPTFSPVANLVYTSAWDATCRLWDAYSGRELVQVLGGHSPIQFHRKDDGRLYLSSNGGEIWEVAVSKTLRTIATSTSRLHFSVGIHPKGRLLACGTEDGVHLCDLRNGREVAFLPFGRCSSTLFHPSDGGLIICGRVGLYHLPVHSDVSGDEYRLGTLRKLDPISTSFEPRACLTPDGRFLAAIAGEKVLFVDYATKKMEFLHGSHVDAGFITISPNAKWVATGARHGLGIRIWNTKKKSVIDRILWPKMHNISCTFSSDGKNLIAGANGDARVWEVGSWAAKTLLPYIERFGCPTFANDGKMFAFANGFGKIELRGSATQKQLAVLQSSSSSEFPQSIGFSANGALLATTSLQGPIEVWDLPQIQKELTRLGLAWKGTDYPIIDRASSQQKPIKIDGVTETIFQYTIQRYRQEITDRPDYAEAHHRLANAYVMGPERLRDPKKALPLSQKAVALAPRNCHYLHVLGIVYYRLGNFKKAVETLHNAIKLRNNPSEATNAYDCFYLAMCCRRLNQPEMAKKYYNDAVQWRIENQERFSLLDQYQDEATRVLSQVEP